MGKGEQSIHFFLRVQEMPGMSRRCRFSTLTVQLLAMAMAGVITGGGVAAETAADVEPGTATGPDETGGEIAPDSDGAVVETDLHMVVAQRMEINDSAVESQVRIDGLSAQAEATVAVYRNTNQRIESLRSYNHQLEEMIRYQDGELAGLRKEIDEVELIAREVMPLMLEMIEALENFVELDVPFLAEERAVRTAELRRLMVRADITDSLRCLYFLMTQPGEAGV